MFPLWLVRVRVARPTLVPFLSAVGKSDRAEGGSSPSRTQTLRGNVLRTWVQWQPVPPCCWLTGRPGHVRTVPAVGMPQYMGITVGSEVIDQRALTTPTMFLSRTRTNWRQAVCRRSSDCSLLPTRHPGRACHLDCLTPRVHSRSLHPAIQPSPYRPCSAWAGTGTAAQLEQSVTRPRIRGIPQYCNNKRRLQIGPSKPP